MAKQILTLARGERGCGWSAKIWDDAEDRGPQANAPLQPQPEGGRSSSRLWSAVAQKLLLQKLGLSLGDLSSAPGHALADS